MTLPRTRRPQSALWVPVIWIFITATRLPSQWLGVRVGLAAQALEEGNPLDRIIFFALDSAGDRHPDIEVFRMGRFLARNVALMAFLSFALVSVVWSDFPFVSFKRWFRDLGNYLVILVSYPTLARWRQSVRCFGDFRIC